MKDWEKEFVVYSLALKMKELGYNEPCFRFYWENSTKMMGDYGSPKSNFDLDNLSKTQLRGLEGTSYCSLPTWQSAFRWFRENHNLKGHIEAVEYLDGTPDTYHWSIFNKCNSGYDQLTYEEAELECLKELIEIVKQK